MTRMITRGGVTWLLSRIDEETVRVGLRGDSRPLRTVCVVGDDALCECGAVDCVHIALAIEDANDRARERSLTPHRRAIALLGRAPTPTPRKAA